MQLVSVGVVRAEWHKAATMPEGAAWVRKQPESWVAREQIEADWTEMQGFWVRQVNGASTPSSAGAAGKVTS